MANLIRWDPFREMMSMRSSMDRLLDRFFEEPFGDWQTADWGLPLDLTENEDEFIVKASVPGIDPDDLEITLSENTLTIKGEIRKEQEKEEQRYHLRERRFGRFTRSISLPANVKSDQIEADYNKGVLTLRLPKTEEVKPKRIPVRSGGQVLEGHFEGNGKKK
jgi:HSP20 family protein